LIQKINYGNIRTPICIENAFCNWELKEEFIARYNEFSTVFEMNPNGDLIKRPRWWTKKIFLALNI